MPEISGEDAIGVLGNSATLTFTVTAAKPDVELAGLLWFFTPTGSSSRTLLSPANLTSRYAFSDSLLSLTISNLTLSDQGTYTLEATNAAGMGSDSVHLDVQSEPIA